MSIECSICIDPLQQEPMAALTCGHVFHKDCVTKWFSQPQQNKCPLCNKITHRNSVIPLFMDTKQDNTLSNKNNNNPNSTMNSLRKAREDYVSILSQNRYLVDKLSRLTREVEILEKEKNDQSMKVRRLRTIQKITEMDSRLSTPEITAKINRLNNSPKEDIILSLHCLFEKCRKAEMELAIKQKTIDKSYQRISELKDRYKTLKQELYRARNNTTDIKIENSNNKRNRSDAPIGHLSLDEELSNRRRGKRPTAPLRTSIVELNSDEENVSDENDQLIISRNMNYNGHLNRGLITNNGNDDNNESDDDTTDDEMTNTRDNNNNKRRILSHTNNIQRPSLQITGGNFFFNNHLSSPSSSAAAFPSHVQYVNDEPSTSMRNSRTSNGRIIMDLHNNSHINHRHISSKRPRLQPASARNGRYHYYLDLTTDDDEENNNTDDYLDADDFEYGRRNRDNTQNENSSGSTTTNNEVYEELESNDTTSVIEK
ncbi:unnamed protein product [Cunninghamella blakesleeana]